ERLALIEGEVADQRQDLGLPFLAVPQVGLFLRVEVADDRIADGPDAGEMSGYELVFLCERQKAVYHLLTCVEDEEIRFHFSVTEESGFRQVGGVSGGFATADCRRRCHGQPGRDEETPPRH